MAKNINHILHVKSSQLVDNKPKLPEASVLLEGELAINYAKDKETISIKNSNGEIVPFSSDYYYSEKKLGSAFTGTNSAKTVTDVIAENELIIAYSLNDLNSRKLDASAYTPVDLSNYYTKTQVDNALEPFFDDAEYDSNTKRINFKHNGSIIDFIDATDFIKDGMVETVRISNGNLIITFNTDAGKENITVPLTDLFNPEDYYTKTETDNLLSAKTNQSDFTAHTANTTVHVTAADKTLWNSVSGKASQSDLNTLSGTVTAHTANTDVHVTTGDKATWNTVTAKTNQSDFTAHTANTTVHVTSADKTLWNSVSGKASQSDLNTLSGTVTSHTANTDVHVTIGDKATWNTVTAKTNQSDFTAHTANTSAHVSNTDRNLWNSVSGKASQSDLTSHVNNSDVHVTTGDKATWNTVTAKTNQSDFTAHTANTTVHVTSADKTLWNSVSGKASQSDLNTLSGTVTSHTANTDVHVTTGDKTTWNTVTAKTNQSDFTAHTANTTAHVSNADRTLWNSVSGKADASAIANFIDSVEYVSNGNAHNIVFYHGTTQIDSIDANDFIKDGMVENATISGSNLVITFNTDAGKQPINIPISSIFDADNYYTKAQVDDKIDIVSGRVSTLSGNVNTLSGTVTSHTANTDVHVTTGDKATWNTVTAKTNQSDFTAHTANTTVHVTAAERTNWNSVSGKASQTDLNTLSGTVTAHTANTSAHVSTTDRTNWNSVSGKASQSDLTAHINNTDVHVTTGDKSTWNTVTAKTNQSDFTAHTANTTVHVTAADKTLWNSVSGKASQSDLTSLSGTVTAHTANTDVHVTTGDKATWNTVTAKTNQSDFTAHTANTTVHVTATDKTLWNSVSGKASQSDLTSHVNNSDVHVTTGDKATWNTVTAKTNQTDFTAHTANTSAHVSNADRNLWNSVSGKVNTSDIANFIDKVEYVVNGNAHDIIFYHGNTQIDSINANDFIKDGMVENATISGSNLVITFNTDAGKQPISIPISDIFNADNYYTKTQVDEKINAVSGKVDTLSGVVTTLSGDVNTLSGKVDTISGAVDSLSGIIEDNELVIASSLTDLDSRKLDASAFTSSMSNVYTKDEIDNAELAISSALNDLNSRVIEISGNSGGDVDELYDMIESISGVVEENELVTAAALNELNINKLDTSAYTPTDLSDYYTKSEIDDSEEVISSALNDLNSRKLDASAYTPVDLSDYVTKVNFDEKLGSGFTGENSGRTVTQVIVENEIVIASSLTDLDTRKLDASAYTGTDLSNYYTKSQVDNLIPDVNPYFDDVEYDSTNKVINFKHGATVKDSIDATAFIKDGMVNTVTVSAVTSGASTVDCLVITFNTDAGKDDIKIPLSSLFDSSNYYNKSEVDNFVNSLSGIIEDNELVVASSLTDLDSRKLDASAFTSSMSNVYTKDEIDNAELAIASALNDLNSRVDEVSGNSIVLDDEFSYSGSSASTNAVEAQAIIKYLEDKDLVIAAALTDLDSRLQGVAYESDLEDLAPLSVFDDSVSASTKPVEAQALYNVITDNEYTTSTALNNLNTNMASHSGTTIPSAVSAAMHLPQVTAADNGKILMVVNGQWALVSPTTIYTGTGTPSSSQGNDGDIYLQTS